MFLVVDPKIPNARKLVHMFKRRGWIEKLGNVFRVRRKIVIAIFSESPLYGRLNRDVQLKINEYITLKLLYWYTVGIREIVISLR